MERGGHGSAGSTRVPHALHKAITRTCAIARSRGRQAERWSCLRSARPRQGQERREGRTRARYGSHDHGHGRRGRSRPAHSTTGTKTRLERSHHPGHGVSWEPQNMLGHRAKSKAKGQPRHQKRSAATLLAGENGHKASVS